MRKHLSQPGTSLVSALMVALTASAVAQTQQAKPPAVNTTQQTSTSGAKDNNAKPQPAAAPLTPEPAQLQAQIDKLYQLAQDLKAAVAKSNKDTLSIDVIKKADAVQQAAKNLKDQMRTSPQTTDHH